MNPPTPRCRCCLNDRLSDLLAVTDVQTGAVSYVCSLAASRVCLRRTIRGRDVETLAPALAPTPEERAAFARAAVARRRPAGAGPHGPAPQIIRAEDLDVQQLDVAAWKPGTIVSTSDWVAYADGEEGEQSRQRLRARRSS
jgi:hypothetical protein